MLIRILLFCLCCGSAAAQAPLQGGWQLSGIASQQEMPTLEGDLKLFIYPQQQAILQLGKAGAYELIPAQWQLKEEDQSLLTIQSKTLSFNWNIQLLEENNLVVEDTKDQAVLSFQAIPQIQVKNQKRVEGDWVLAEQLGKMLNPEDSKTPRIQLASEGKALLQNWPSKDSSAKWIYLPEGNFLKLYSTKEEQYFEVLYSNKDYLLLRDQMMVYIFQHRDSKTLNFRQAERKLYGHWQALNPQYPIKKASLIFRKDGSVNAVSNLNTSLNRWELTEGNTYIHFHPYQTESKEDSYLLRLRFIDKNTIILSDKDMTVIFKKKA